MTSVIGWLGLDAVDDVWDWMSKMTRKSGTSAAMSILGLSLHAVFLHGLLGLPHIRRNGSFMVVGLLF